MEELKAKRDDLLRRITREEDGGLQRLAKIKVWLTRVETVEKNITSLLSVENVKHQNLYFCGFCSKNSRSSYRYGKRVFLALKDVQKLNSEVFEIVTEQAQTTEVEERPIQPIIVGQETMLDKAWKHIMDDDVGTMGMYGMGGVGKTTLLIQLNNKFSGERCGLFDFVIWVVVSKEPHLEKIQDEIAQKVGFNAGDKHKRVNLYNFLRKKSFLLFLDDIWEKLDLAEIGVPFPTTENRCKVAFTTRSQDVCARMGVQDPMEVQCLTENEALDLFQKKVGQRTLASDPEIPDLARIVAKKCSGLPLALSVIGETMSCKRTIKEWDDAINVLDSYAVEFSGMEDKILPLLKYSYDDLKNDNVKKCLLYCSLFPEDDIIPKEKLIEYWICERIIDGRWGIERAENKGYAIIGSLVRASLLLDVFSPHETDSVRMHDVIREMALWIASDLGIQKEAYIVHAGDRLHKITEVENWNVVRRMSLMKNNIKYQFAGSYECLELTTLLLQSTDLENISSKFFKSMPKLVVLDLSDNRKLAEIPDTISKLGSLQYLNLSKTGIRRLPLGLRELKKLIHLDLEKTEALLNIAGISSLHNLKVLKLAFSYFSWDLGTVEELITLEQLEILTTSFYDSPAPCVEKFLSSHRLAGSTRTLKITNMDAESSKILFLVTMDKLRDFIVTDCSISEIKLGSICIKGNIVSIQQNPRNPCFLSLSKVCITGCKRLKELTYLMFAPNIKSLEVDSSNELENIICEEKVCEGGDESSLIIPFPKLVTLTLHFLQNLKSIYWRPLPFLRLKTINVVQCPNLKKLPLDSQSGKEGEDGLIIKYGEEEWFDGLEWVDEVTKIRFLSSSK